jgi:hypothetical protein
MLTLATEEKNEYYNTYVRTVMGTNPVYVDIHGNSARIINYFKKRMSIVPKVFLLSTQRTKYKEFPKEAHKYIKDGSFLCLAFSTSGSPIEMLNYDRIGSLHNYGPHGPLRHRPEYNIRFIEPYHQAMAELMNRLHSLEDSLTSHHIERLELRAKLKQKFHVKESVETATTVYRENKMFLLINQIFEVIGKQRPMINVLAPPVIVHR